MYTSPHRLPGAQPTGTGPAPTSLHGPISTFEHPNAAGRLARGAVADDVIGNRIYLAWGVGDGGVMQFLDRKKTLPAPYGTRTGDPTNPIDAQLESSQAVRRAVDHPRWSENRSGSGAPVRRSKLQSFGPLKNRPFVAKVSSI